MVSQTESRFTNIPGDGAKEALVARENGQKAEIFLSPGFKSAAAMAGWDEEDLIIASFIVEDTPERSSSKRRRRSNFLFKSPPSSGSRRKQRIKRSPVQFPIIDLDEVIKHEENNKTNKETKTETQKDKKTGKDEKILSEQNQNQNVSSSDSVPLPCIDKLRDELSCAICLEICFEPSTTTCGHSFCKKCLRSAADKCGRKCPKCRQLISNGRYCTVNTVLWNTIQLLFPQEVEARRAASTAASTPSPRNQRLKSRNKETASYEEDNRVGREDLSRLFVSSSGEGNGRRRRMRVDQDRDAALALRLQRREFASAFGVTPTTSSSSSNLSMARANLRAMASRAVQTQQRRQGH